MSWLTKFGSTLKSIFTNAQTLEQKAEPIVESLLPASIPVFDVFDTGIEIAKDVEAGFASAGVVKGGSQKLVAALPGFGAALDAYTTAKFPGSTAVLKSEAYIASKPVLMNAIVNYINALPETLTVAPTPSSIIVAAATSAAVSAAKVA
jgi:hypothetical protein